MAGKQQHNWLNYCFHSWLLVIAVAVWPDWCRNLVSKKKNQGALNYFVGLWTYARIFWLLAAFSFQLAAMIGLALDFDHLHPFPCAGSRRSHLRAGLAILFSQTRYLFLFVVVLFFSNSKIARKFQSMTAFFSPFRRHTQIDATSKRDRITQTIIYQSCP